MAVSTIQTYFCRGPSCLDDLLNERQRRPVRVQVVKVIQLNYEQYRHFLRHISEDMPFLAANKGLTDCEAHGVNRCLLVTCRDVRGGILVDCQGHDCARYAAEVPDRSALDLRDVPVDRCGLRPQRPRGQRDR